MDRFKRFTFQVTIFLVANPIFLCAESLDKKRRQSEQSYAIRIENNKSDSLWAGIVGGCIGAAAGVALGHWLTLPSRDEVVESVVIIDQPQYSVRESAKTQELKYRLNEFSKYNQIFDFSHCEQAVIANLYKLGLNIADLDSNFYTQLKNDYDDLYDLGYAIWWHRCKNLEAQKNIYLATCKQLNNYFAEHYDFIHACNVVKKYEDLPCSSAKLSSWIYAYYKGKQLYPLITFVAGVESDIQFLVRLKRQKSHTYPQITRYANRLIDLLQDVTELMYSSYEYQQETMKKRQDEILQEQNRLEKEKLALAKRQVQALEKANRIAEEQNRIDYQYR